MDGVFSVVKGEDIDVFNDIVPIFEFDFCKMTNNVVFFFFGHGGDLRNFLPRFPLHADDFDNIGVHAGPVVEGESFDNGGRLWLYSNI